MDDASSPSRDAPRESDERASPRARNPREQAFGVRRGRLKQGAALAVSFLLGVAVTLFAHRMRWIPRGDEAAPRGDAMEWAQRGPPRASSEPATPPQASPPARSARAGQAETNTASTDGSEAASTDGSEAAEQGAARARAEPGGHEPRPGAERPAAPKKPEAANETAGEHAAAASPLSPLPESLEPDVGSAKAASSSPPTTSGEASHGAGDTAEPDPHQPVTAEVDEQELDRMLERALGDEADDSSEPSEPPRASVPSKQDIAKAVSVLFPAIEGCAQGKSGTAVVDLVVRNDGRVLSAHVSGHPFAGTAAGRCIEGVMRRARFPEFEKPSFRVRYPLQIGP